MVYYPCKCFETYYLNKQIDNIKLHTKQQNTKCDAWKQLLKVIDIAAEDKREEFVPKQELERDDWSQIITLPRTIAKLKSVKRLMLLNSNLVRIPPEIGQMTNLEKIDVHMSYKLHWFPYEITRCKKLKDSSVSTRSLYGNFKYRFPFPKLPVGLGLEINSPTRCSVCNTFDSASSSHQIWISLQIATDVLPLLVNACSKACLDKLPHPPNDYIQEPHRGGINLQQPHGHYTV